MALYDPPARRYPLARATLARLRSLTESEQRRAAQLLSGPYCQDTFVTTHQFRNLLTLAEGLLELPADYSGFHMHYYRVRSAFDDCDPPLSMLSPSGEFEGYGDPMRVPNVCGTVACAVGHAPEILGVAPRLYESWDGYAEWVFGDLPEDLFSYCFDSDWDQHDNTPQGAAARIVHLLEVAASGATDAVGLLHYFDLQTGPPSHRATVRTRHLALLESAE